MGYVEKQGCNVISFANEDGYYQKIFLKDRNVLKTPDSGMGEVDDDIEGIKRAVEDGVFLLMT